MNCNLTNIFVTVGASTNQKDHLKFLFERNEDFCVIPSFGVTPPFGAMARLTSADGLTIDPTQVCFESLSSYQDNQFSKDFIVS